MLFPKSIELASKAHRGQFRKHMSFVPYIFHPFDVANRLIDWGVNDDIVLSAAMMHGVIENTPYTYEFIADRLNVSVANLVLECTCSDPGGRDLHLKHVAHAASQDAILIKIADELSDTCDYIGCGEHLHAMHYFQKAECIFSRGAKYSSDIWAKALDAVNEVRRKL